MPLDDDAQQIVLAVETSGPQPSMRELGAVELRKLLALQAEMSPSPEGPSDVEFEDREIPGPHGGIPVRIYRPPVEEVLPALVYLHGGGWTFGTLDEYDAVCRTLAARTACVVVSVDYRLAPEHKFPVPLEECCAAFDWVAAHCTELRIHPDKIAVGGDSAGAGLALGVAQLAASKSLGGKIRCLLLVYPGTEHGVPRPSWLEHGSGPLISSDDIKWLWENYVRDESDYENPLVVPSLTKDLAIYPPTFIQTAEYDPLRDDGEHFGNRLIEAGVHAMIKRYDGVFHGFYPMVGILKRTTIAVDDSAAYLRGQFASP